MHNEKTHHKIDCLASDETDSIKVIVWENATDKVKREKTTISFQNLTIFVYLATACKYANTNESMISTEIDDVPNVHFATPAFIKANYLPLCQH